MRSDDVGHPGTHGHTPVDDPAEKRPPPDRQQPPPQPQPALPAPVRCIGREIIQPPQPVVGRLRLHPLFMFHVFMFHSPPCPSRSVAKHNSSTTHPPTRCS